MDTEEHEELADEFERRADEMHRENAKLSEEIDSVRKDWETKRSDESVPGAVPRDDDLSSTSSTDEAQDGPSAARPGRGRRRGQRGASRRPRARARRRLTRILAVQVPVAHRGHALALVVLILGPRGEHEAGDRPLSPLVVAVEQVDLQPVA